MNAARVETTVEADGELHLTQLPCRRGDKVEAIVLYLGTSLAARPERPARKGSCRSPGSIPCTGPFVFAPVGRPLPHARRPA